MAKENQSGFTLIELSIVLVIVGLIVGGVLVGQDLISAATVRAQISQIEKYNTATNTFYGKYGYLPGDMPDPYASQNGFLPRGQYAGQGDGNGIIESNFDNVAGGNSGTTAESGETAVFWVDLSHAGFIDSTFNTATENTVLNGGLFITPTSTPNLSQILPAAKIGNGNYVSVWSDNGVNYYSISNVSELLGGILATPQMTVAQAYSIDKKLDDGLPLSGHITVQYENSGVTTCAGGHPGEPPWQLHLSEII